MSSDAAPRVSFEPAERRAVATMALVLCLRMFGLFVLMPVLALYASELPGGTPELAGLAVGAFGIAQALLQVPAGLLSDRFGRKAVIVFGLLVFAAGSIVAAQSTTIAGVLVGRVLQGAGAISAAATALVADLTRPAVRTRAMAVVGIAIGLSFMVALAFGAQLAAWVGVPGLFVIGAAAALAGAALVVLGPGSFAPPASAVRREGVLRVLFDRRLLPYNAGVFVLHAMLTATFVALPFVLRDSFGLGRDDHAQVYFFAMALSLVGTVPLILLVERARRPAAVLLAGVLLLTAGQGVLALELPLLGIIGALALFFAGFNFLEARLPARVSEVAGEATRGAALGAFATGQYLGAFVGGALGGIVLGAAGAGGVFTATLALGVGWIALGLWTSRRRSADAAAAG